MPTQMSPLIRGAVEDAQRELAGRFRGVLSQEAIGRVLDDSYELIGERLTVVLPTQTKIRLAERRRAR